MADMRLLRVKSSWGRRRPGTPITIAVGFDGSVSATYDERAPLVRFGRLAELLELHGLTEADLKEQAAPENAKGA